MGGSSKKQTIGYRYYLGIHMVWVHAADRLLNIKFDKKAAWQGDSTGGEIYVSAESLFGGEKKEGGVSGFIDVEMGHADQMENAYLQSQLGANIPAFRKVVSLVLKQFYLGMNPYLKLMSARFQRIHKTTDDAVMWYDAKAAIPLAGTGEAETYILNETDFGWEYKIVAHHSNPGTTNLDFPTSGTTLNGQGPFGSGSYTSWNTAWPEATILWARQTVPCIPGGQYILRFQVENGGLVWINGTLVGIVNQSNSSVSGNPVQEFDIPVELTSTGFFEVKTKSFDETGSHGATYNIISIRRPTITGDADMNPAHIIREALVDPDWGMGYLAADIDDVSFMAAADQLYAEQMGISIVWDRQMPLEEFIKEIVRHINAALYVGRTTGKFVLKLIRDDYDVGDLITLDKTNVDKVDSFSYATFGEHVNSVSVGYWDSLTNTKASVTESDPALVQMEGTVINTTIQYPGFTNGIIAGRVCRRDLASLSRPLRSCTIYATAAEAKDLNIGDPFIFDPTDLWPNPTAPLEPVVMRAMGLALGDGLNNKVRITAMQDAFALPLSGGTDGPDPIWEDPNTPAVAATERLVTEAPYFELLQQESDQVAVDALLTTYPDAGFVLATAERPASNAINMEILTDSGAGYESTANADFSPTAVLDADVDFDDTAWTIANGVELSNITLGTRCQVDDEECVVTAVSDTALTVGRGVIDTVPRKHVIGAKIFFHDEYAQLAQVQFADGESVDVKLLTVSGSNKLLEGAAPVDSVTMASRAIRPYPPGKIRIDGVTEPVSASGPTVVTWTHRDRVLQADQLVDTEAASVGPNEYTRYALRIFDDMDVLLVEKLNIAGVTATFDLTFTGDITIELYSISNYGESWQKHERTFAYTAEAAVVDVITSDDWVIPNGPIIDGGEVIP